MSQSQSQSPSPSQGSSPTLAVKGPYLPTPGVFDEMMFPDGTVRPHWRTFASFLEQCSPSDLTSRADTIQRLLYDHGVTYNVFDDTLGTSRPWMLDVLPFLVSNADFQTVSTALSQRLHPRKSHHPRPGLPGGIPHLACPPHHRLLRPHAGNPPRSLPPRPSR